MPKKEARGEGGGGGKDTRYTLLRGVDNKGRRG